MEALSILGGAVTAGTIIKGLKITIVEFREIKDARKHIGEFYDQACTFVDVVSAFFKVMDTYLINSESEERRATEDVLKRIMRLFHGAKEDLDALLNKVIPRDVDNRPVFSDFMTRVAWYFKEGSVKRLRYSMTFIEHSACLYEASSLIAKLQRENAELRARGQAVSQPTHILLVELKKCDRQYLEEKIQTELAISERASRDMQDIDQELPNEAARSALSLRRMQRVERLVMREVDQVISHTVRQERAYRQHRDDRDSGLDVSARGVHSSSSHPSTQSSSQSSYRSQTQRTRRQESRNEGRVVIPHPENLSDPLRLSRPAPRLARSRHTVHGVRYRDNGHRQWTEHGEWPNSVTRHALESDESQHGGSTSDAHEQANAETQEAVETQAEAPDNSEAQENVEAPEDAGAQEDAEAASPPPDLSGPKTNENPRSNASSDATGDPSTSQFRPVAPYTMEEWHAFNERRKRRLRRKPGED